MTSWGRSARDVEADDAIRYWRVLCSEGGGDLGVEDGEGVEEAGLVVVEGHADLVADGGAGAADVVGLPEGGDLGDEVVLEGFELRLGDGDAVELLEEVGDAAALEHDAAAGDLGGVRGEDGGDADAAEQGVGLVGGDAGSRRRRRVPRRSPRWGWRRSGRARLERRRRLRWLVSARLMSSK